MRGSVLIVDDDQCLSKLVAEVLGDEGFVIFEVSDTQTAVIRAEIARLEPDVVLLDGGEGIDYGHSWANAAWMHERSRPIPVIMFTGHAEELVEAQMGVSQRSKNAAFVGFVSKPFDVVDLIGTVTRVVGEPPRVNLIAYPETDTPCMAPTVPPAWGSEACWSSL